MNITCDIIQDLLPLYCDRVCSEDSKQAIEAHLQECEQCREDLLRMQGDIKGGATCPVDNNTVLDIFVIPDRYDIHGYPIPLDNNQQEID